MDAVVKMIAEGKHDLVPLPAGSMTPFQLASPKFPPDLTCAAVLARQQQRMRQWCSPSAAVPQSDGRGRALLPRKPLSMPHAMNATAHSTERYYGHSGTTTHFSNRHSTVYTRTDIHIR